MTYFSRYFLIGILVSGLAVDHAAARRLFQRRVCLCRCHTRCVEACPSACPMSSSCGCVDSEIVADSHCTPEEPFFADSACQTCESETLSGYASDLVPELVPDYAPSFTPDYVPDSASNYVDEELFETTPAPTEWSGPTQGYTSPEVTESLLFESPVDPPISQPITPPASSVTPEATELPPTSGCAIA